jgi:hypothetical protein
MSDRVDRIIIDSPHGKIPLVIHQPNAELLANIRKVMDFYHPPQDAPGH